MYIPYNLSLIVSPFVAKDFNKGVVEVTGQIVNQGAGYGMEVSCTCTYWLYRPQRYVDYAKESILKFQNDFFHHQVYLLELQTIFFILCSTKLYHFNYVKHLVLSAIQNSEVSAL